MPKAKEEQNLRITAFYFAFWLLILCLVTYLFANFIRLHWPKIIATLYPSPAQEVIIVEAPPDAQNPLPSPLPAATSSTELISNLLQAILTATSSATASSEIQASASTFTQDAPQAKSQP